MLLWGDHTLFPTPVCVPTNRLYGMLQDCVRSCDDPTIPFHKDKNRNKNTLHLTCFSIATPFKAWIKMALMYWL